MNLFPYVKEEKFEEVKEQRDRMEEELEKYQSKYEAESERRSALASEKQKLDREVNQLKQKLKTLEDQKDQRSEKKVEAEINWYSKDQFSSLVNTLSSLRSPKKDITTIFLTRNPSKKTKKSIRDIFDEEKSRKILNHCPMVFVSTSFGLEFKFRVNEKFYSDDIITGKTVDLDTIRDYINQSKHVLVLRAGSARLFKLKNLEANQVWSIEDRIDRKHSKGGFSQSRFENLRSESIKNFLNKVRDQINKDKQIQGLGNKKLTDRLDIDYFGGFDDNKGVVRSYYKPQELTIKSK